MALPPIPADVAAAYAAFPDDARARLLELRRLIFETAAETAGVGALHETLKWGEPAYLTAESRSGSTIRLAWKAAKPDRVGVYFICTTRLVDTFRTHFAEELAFDGNRAIVLAVDASLPREPLAACIAMALTYHCRDRAP